LTHPDLPAGCNQDTQMVEIFFTKWATNNPDGSVPNCFYYWVRTSADNGERTQTGGISYDATAPYMGYYNGNSLGTNPIYVCGNSTNERGHTNINEFSATTIHEGLHRDHDAERGVSTDTDGDWLIDTKETSDDLDLDYVRSAELYTDTNGNGQYDQGEPFDDVGLIRKVLSYSEWKQGNPETDVTYGDNNGVWDQEGPNIPEGQADVATTSKYHANTHGGDYDDEDDTCYAIEENAADATSEDWANPGSNSSS